MNTQSNDKDLLIKRRDALRSRLDAIRRDVAQGLDADSGERAVQLENAEVLDEIARVAQEELEEIEKKLVLLR